MSTGIRRPYQTWDGRSTRIGNRQHVEGVASAVRIQRDGFMRKRTIVIDALLDNLSMSGAGLFVPADSDLKSGTAAEVQIDGAWGHVRLVRVTPTSNPGTVYCGVLFHEANPDFHEAVLRLL